MLFRDPLLLLCFWLISLLRQPLAVATDLNDTELKPVPTLPKTAPPARLPVFRARMPNKAPTVLISPNWMPMATQCPPRLSIILLAGLTTLSPD